MHIPLKKIPLAKVAPFLPLPLILGFRELLHITKETALSDAARFGILAFVLIIAAMAIWNVWVEHRT